MLAGIGVALALVTTADATGGGVRTVGVPVAETSRGGVTDPQDGAGAEDGSGPTSDAGTGPPGDRDDASPPAADATAADGPAPGSPDPSGPPPGTSGDGGGPASTSDGSVAPYTDGYLPPQWMRDVGFACGSPVTDLDDGDPSLTTEVTGEFDVATGTLRAKVEGDVAAEDIVGSPLVVWSQDEVIVDMGMGWHEADYELAEALAADGTWTGDVLAPQFSTCQEDTEASEGMGLDFDNERAAGTYEVRVVTLHGLQEHGERVDRLDVSDPVDVTVP
ncbi:hypothetical protein GCM10028784_37340 [Myceligenerans cantabricum]